MRRGLVALVVGLLLAVGAPLSWYVLGGRGPTDVGPSVLDRAAAPTAATTSPASEPRPVGVGAPATRSALLADSVQPGDPPVAVTLDGALAEVDPVGAGPDGEVTVPEDVRRVGWYAPGPAPGSPNGAAVLVGHVDDAVQGLGVFASLLDSEPGDVVTVRTAAGLDLRYDVVSREQLDKRTVPMERIFTTTGPPHLVLITCGGSFDPAARSYDDNVVVTAVPRT